MLAKGVGLSLFISSLLYSLFLPSPFLSAPDDPTRVRVAQRRNEGHTCPLCPFPFLVAVRGVMLGNATHTQGRQRVAENSIYTKDSGVSYTTPPCLSQDPKKHSSGVSNPNDKDMCGGL